MLTVLRGNVGPNPLFVADPSGGIAPENRISFTKAVSASSSNVAGDTAAPRLSRWLSYNSTYTDRVTLSENYTTVTGMAFNTTLSDPDNSAVVTFSTSGAFPNHGNATSYAFGSGNTRATLAYQAQGTTTITTSGSSTLGLFVISNVGSNGYTLANEPFNLTLTQTAPWPLTVTINCTLSGTITSSTSFVAVTFPTPSNNLQGALYTRFANPVNTNGTTAIAISVTAPQPNRLTAKVTGFGPRSAQKQMQMLLSRFAFDYTATNAITIRSADDNSLLTFSAGNSAQYNYSGFDNAGALNLSAFGVTSSPDYLYLTGLTLPANQAKGSPSAIQQISVSSLPSWLQTADAARAMVSAMRTAAQNGNRYFTTATPPADFGTSSQPVLTFVDGDADLPPAGGAGLLIVTGAFTMTGSSAFDGLVLVLGGGQFLRTGGGNGNSLGSLLVARFGASGNFLAPTFNSNGSGTSAVLYDSAWVRKALASSGPRVMAIGEF